MDVIFLLKLDLRLLNTFQFILYNRHFVHKKEMLSLSCNDVIRDENRDCAKAC